MNCLSQDKKKLAIEDYKLWHKILMGTSSNDGTWLSYTKSYKNNEDTLFLSNTLTKDSHIFPNGTNDYITPNGKLFAYQSADTLKLMETSSGNTLERLNVKHYQVSKNGKFLIYYQKRNVLHIMEVDTGKEYSIENIIDYSVNSQGDYISVIQKYLGKKTVELISLNNLKTQRVLLVPERLKVKQITWGSTGKSLAFMLLDKDFTVKKVVSIPNIEEVSEVFELDPSTMKGFPQNRDITNKKMLISDDGSQVFFDTVAQETFDISNIVQVWKSTDKRLPPRNRNNYYQWNVWKPRSNTMQIIEDDTLKVCAIMNNQKQAILLDNKRYLPLYEYGDRYSDVYVMDLGTGIKTKIIEKQLRAHNHLVTSIYDHFIAYFKDNHWWSYDIKNRQHICLTKDLKTVFNKKGSDRLDAHRAYGFGGWTNNGSIIVYDAFDIWLLSLDGDYVKKITNGSDSHIKHRMYTSAKKSLRDSFFGHVSTNYDLEKGVIIKTINTDTYDEGFGFWTLKKGFKELLHKNRRIPIIKRTQNLSVFFFLESTFDVPPRLMKINKFGQEFPIALSNTQQDKFYWGKSELIHYLGPNGEALKGALFYPGGYDARKKYPMIVSIYEKRSDALHHYTMPSDANYGGLNIANYTTDGYFVLMPDIAYILNKPGTSAVTSVLSSIDKVNESVSIDLNKIGLIGHSFGGFETTYIISQTDRFRTAVAGAGVTDLLSFYLDIDSANLSNMERFESEQFRNKIPFTDPAFSYESPIMNVKTIDTPIMLFIGDKDQMVKPSYNIKLFAALWRLKKESVLLIYPNEGHTILSENHLRDLTLKTKNWFDYYLKEDVKTKWMGD
ncbi:prolyl oligopeptidase family serine peptidase [Mesoflavibacter zeaxanthinifaciens]|uniref:S9 family peptidase n=1 Tax=Mesoflavibacter zeaxanthinifaciens TaxID=393060 RepID=UPI003A8FE18B